MAMKNRVTNRDLELPTEKVVPGGVYENPLSDRGFKKLLSSVSSLTNFLNGVMHLNKEHEIEKLKFKTKKISYVTADGSGSEKETWSFDIRAQTRDGRAIDVEVQNLKHEFFEDRVLIYGSALLLKAKAELDKERSDTDKKKMEARNPPVLTTDEKKERRRQMYELPDTVSVWICNFPLPSNSTKVWDCWMMYSENELNSGSLLPITDRIKYIFLQLPNFKKSAEELESVQDQWIYVLKHAFVSSKEIDIKNDAVTEALERIKAEIAEEPEEPPPMITKKERECTIASIEHWAELRGEKHGRAEAAAEIEALRAEIKNLKAELAAKSST